MIKLPIAYLWILGLTASFVAWSGAEVTKAEPPSKPNIVILLADDLGYGDLSCNGSWIQTPNIDQLAAKGLRFTDFHSNGALCSPSRCALMTGRYQQRAGLSGLVSRKKEDGLKKEEYTLADAMRSAGYATALFGKWHLGGLPEYNPINHGFDEYIGLLGGRIDYFTHNDADGNTELDWQNGLKPLEEKGYSTTLIGDHSVDFIRRNSTKPFCLYVAFNGVHTPIQEPETGEISKSAETYGRMVQSVDQNIGRIIAALEENGLSDKTLVFFTSDNGGHEGIAGSSNKPLSGFKGTLWEGGHRVAGIAKWRGHIPAGGTTGETAMLIDLLPTALELTGTALPPERKVDGVSLVSLLTQNKPLPPRPLFWFHANSWAMRDGPWKLMTDGLETHLFNLEADLAEKNDLAKQQPERVQTMRAALEAWYQEVAGRKIIGKSKDKPGKKAEK